MKKKIVILALCTGLLAGTSVQAQKVRLVPDTQKVVFTDSIAPDTLGMYFIVKEGGDINDNSQVYALKNAKSNAEGKIEFSFVMPEEKNSTPSDGKYDIYIKEAGEARKLADVQLVYASLETRNALLDEIKAIPQDETKAQKLQEILANPDNQIALEAIGCKLDGEAGTITNMCEAISDFSNITLEEFKDKHNYASVIDDLGSADANETDEILEVIDPVFEDVRYSDITDESLTKWLSGYFAGKEYTKANYELANILYKFNTYVADKIDNLFEKYASALGITGDRRYTAYASTPNKSGINLKIANILDKTPAKTANDLLSAVSKSMPTDSGSGSGSGSGGGTGGGGITPPVASTTGGAASAGLAGFKDLDKAEWARVAVTSLANAGIVAGDENGNFRPNDYVTREEYVKMLVVAAEKHNIYATCEFKDVPKDAWYHSYVASAKQFGLTSGISEDEFGTGRPLTRQDMAVLSLNAKGDIQEIRDDIVFGDGGKIADYAKNAVSKLYKSGAINGTGDGNFTPLGKATRAECAQIIYNLFIK